METLTATEALDLVAKQAQWCRENGESDMRNILNYVRAIKPLVAEGKTRDEIIAYFADDEDEDA
jgi:hypothetical protein